MGQILIDLENPSPKPAVVLPKIEIVPEKVAIEEPAEVMEDIIETRKTVSQALREWDISSVEKIIIDHDEDSRNTASDEDDDKKNQNKPWYVRKNTK